jgi:hypothetical protein
MTNPGQTVGRVNMWRRSPCTRFTVGDPVFRALEEVWRVSAKLIQVTHS